MRVRSPRPKALRKLLRDNQTNSDFSPPYLEFACADTIPSRNPTPKRNPETQPDQFEFCVTTMKSTQTASLATVATIAIVLQFFCLVISGAAAAQLMPWCARPIQLDPSIIFDLSPLAQQMNEDMVVQVTPDFLYTFSVCTALPQKCPNTEPGPHTRSMCGNPGSALVCESFKTATTACAASALIPQPVYSLYKNGSIEGISITVGGGDICMACGPSPFRKFQFDIICDGHITSSPKIVSAKPFPDYPDPTSYITLRHCSGCPTDSPSHCSRAVSRHTQQRIPYQRLFLPSNSSSSSFNLDIDFVAEIGLTSSISLLPPSMITLQVSSEFGNDLSIRGTLLSAQQTTISIQVIAGVMPLIGTIDFDTDNQTVALTLVNDAGEKQPCSPARPTGSGPFKLTCQTTSAGTLIVRGNLNQ